MDFIIQELSRRVRDCLSARRTESGRRKCPPTGDYLDVENPFIKDERKLLCSKAIRVLSCKTQVSTIPVTPLIRNRMTHTLEVSACATTISEILGLNTDLVRAIAIGHDIGHVPFGHQGEDFVSRASGLKKFCHEIMGPIIAQKIERKGQGLNLCHETLEGMMRHSGNTATPEMSQEAWVVRYADKIAYLFADWNDITVRMRYPVSAELRGLVEEFGPNQRARVMKTIAALVEESAENDKVSFEHSRLAKKFNLFRKLMLEVYPCVVFQDPVRVMEPVLEFLKRLKIGDPFLLFALMTDKDVLYLNSIEAPDMYHVQQTALAEILPYVKDYGDIDLCDPCLDW